MFFLSFDEAKGNREQDKGLRGTEENLDTAVSYDA